MSKPAVTSYRRRYAALRRRSIAATAVLSLAALGLSCASNDSASQPLTEPAANTTTPQTTQVPAVNLPSVVVTYSVLGAVVSELVGDAADVRVLIPDGQDPHDYEPSARDIEAINGADLVVSNGLDLEAGLDGAIERAQQAGVPVFVVADHVSVLDVVDVNDHAAHGHTHAGADSSHSHDHDDDHDHTQDPHLWLSPATIREALPALGATLAATLDANLDNAVTRFDSELADLDSELREKFSSLKTCEFVTGHNELGYFSQRYGCTVLAAIIASQSTTAEATARNVEFVIDVVKTHGAKVIFTSLGTNRSVADQIAKRTNTRVVELNTHFLGTSTDYVSFIRTLGTTIADALR